MKTYTLHTDGGHGWIAVKLSELDELGIRGKVSSYSYQRGETAYLEEDCDLGLFFEAYEAKHGTQPKYAESYRDRSPIRNYESYQAPVQPSPLMVEGEGAPQYTMFDLPKDTQLSLL